MFGLADATTLFIKHLLGTGIKRCPRGWKCPDAARCALREERLRRGQTSLRWQEARGSPQESLHWARLGWAFLAQSLTDM